MLPDLQPTHLANLEIRLRPLLPDDFGALYQIAADPLLWEQHPARNRYERPVFEQFFADALCTGSAFVVLDSRTNAVIGSSRYYNYNPARRISIGFTFLDRAYWGTTYNRSLKQLMLDYAFTFANEVIFDVGMTNFRSQRAVEKLGAQRLIPATEQVVDDQEIQNYVYQLNKTDWLKQTTPTT